jgi:flagellar protein FliO/FliZ
MDPFFQNLIHTLLALAAVSALAWVVLRVMRSRIQQRSPGAIRTHDDALRFVRALAVGAKERVVIVEHRGERWMLGVSTGGITTIAHWAGAQEARALPGTVEAGRP